VFLSACFYFKVQSLAGQGNVLIEAFLKGKMAGTTNRAEASEC
jgi:hypothetical protein